MKIILQMVGAQSSTQADCNGFNNYQNQYIFYASLSKQIHLASN